MLGDKELHQTDPWLLLPCLTAKLQVPLADADAGAVEEHTICTRAVSGPWHKIG